MVCFKKAPVFQWAYPMPTIRPIPHPPAANLPESIAQGFNIDVPHEQIRALALALPLEPRGEEKIDDLDVTCLVRACDANAALRHDNTLNNECQWISILIKRSIA